MSDGRADVAVIGAGQAGLSAAWHLAHRATGRFVVFDANPAPGGAWQHRWRGLTMATVNGIFALPGQPVPPVDPAEPAVDAVPRYFADYERTQGLAIRRPERVTAVRSAGPGTDGPLDLAVASGDPSAPSSWRVRAVINATGTWNHPLIPTIPGVERFRGRVLHARDYRAAADFAGRRVAVVGAGITAVQLLAELSEVTDTRWYVRRPPEFEDGSFRAEHEGRDTIQRVEADTQAGRAPRSIVSYTRLVWSEYALAARARGALAWRPMFTRVTPTGVVEADGSLTTVDAIVWATGYRADLAHLEPLGLQNAEGGIPMAGTRVAADPRIHLIGYGPSQSTVGANRAGRDAVTELIRTRLQPVSATS